MPIELPFTLKIDFEIKENQLFKQEILIKIFEEISEITPLPELTITTNNIEQYEQTCAVAVNYKHKVKYNLNYHEGCKPPEECINLIIPLNQPNLYQTVKKYCKNNLNIILKPETKSCELNFKEYELIKQDKSLHNIFIQPYMTEKEIQNFSKEVLNREFLTCAAPWLNPVIDAQGDVYCCEFNKIGNIKNNSILELWNTSNADEIRNLLIKNKNCVECTKCLKKYNESFIIADNAQFEYKDKIYKFPSVINYVQSSPKTAIAGTALNDKEYEVLPYPVFDSVKDIEQEIKSEILLLLE